MEQLLQKTLEAAKKNLVRDGYVIPAIMLFKNGALHSIIVIKSGDLDRSFYEVKEMNFCAAGMEARRIDADAVLSVMDCAVVATPEGTNYDDTMAPTSFPRSMRMEAIVVASLTLPEGKEGSLYCCYKGGGETKEPVEFIDGGFPKDVVFKNRFHKIVLGGYNAKPDR